MSMKKCNRLVWSSYHKRYFKCCRSANHWRRKQGRCTANLTGLRLAHGIVLKRASDFTQKTGTNKGVHYAVWFVKQDCGRIRKIRACSILNGAARLRYISNRWTSQNGKTCPEYKTVTHHYDFIFKSKNPIHRCYKNMPFYDEWNPNKGGAYWKGSKWIILNLGSKPGPSWSLDIIEHRLGFVPGNLRWALKNNQSTNKQHRKLGQISIKELTIEAKRRGYKLIKIFT